MTTQDVIDYYTGLLIVQYASLGNARGTVAALMKRLIQDQIIAKVRDGFDVTTAIGAQLNILGKYRGVARVLFGAAPGSYWSLVEYTDPLPGSYFGWAEYTDAPPTWNTEQYADLNSVAYSLSDFQLRTLIELAAQIHGSPLNLGTIDKILFSFFGTNVNLVDNLDMTIVYNHLTADPDPNKIWALAVIAGLIPHPAGVAFTTVEV